MQIGRVVGHATSTVKHASMRGAKLLVVQPYMADGVTPDADPQLCVDVVGAGRGDRVLISSDGKYAREFLKSDQTPVRWTVIGIQDERP
ncbi:MAG: EutN/CcmL family microcompartment protein [Pirellulaceae bacterium]